MLDNSSSYENVKNIVEQIISAAQVDWVPSYEFIWLCKAGNGGALDHGLVREVVHQVLGAGLMQIGDIGPEGFEPWSENDTWELKFLSIMQRTGWNPGLEGPWFALTGDDDAPTAGKGLG